MQNCHAVFRFCLHSILSTHKTHLHPSVEDLVAITTQKAVVMDLSSGWLAFGELCPQLVAEAHISAGFSMIVHSYP